MPTGMLVVDDHELVRLGMRSLVQSHAADKGRSVQVLEARSLDEALQVYAMHGHTVGLVLLDLHLPDAHGLSGLSTFLHRFPAARVVVLSGVHDPALVRQALTLGAQAFLTKSGDLQQVVNYIRSLGMLRTGRTPDEPTTHQGGTGQIHSLGSDGTVVALSGRQTQILDWVLAGKSNREIAQHAHLSEGTVKNVVSTLLLRFGVRSRAQLITLLR